jgi:hypothetical protein
MQTPNKFPWKIGTNPLAKKYSFPAAFRLGRSPRLPQLVWLRSILRLRIRMASAGRKELKAISSLTKQELLQELTEAGQSPDPKWTVPELRALLSEYRAKWNPQAASGKGLSTLTKQQLQEECDRYNIPYDSKMTRGVLMLKLRYAIESQEVSGNTVITFGKHKGMLYKEVLATKPKYVEWAIETAKTTDHRELIQLGTWLENPTTEATPAAGPGFCDGPDEDEPVPVNMAGSSSNQAPTASTRLAATPKPTLPTHPSSLLPKPPGASKRTSRTVEDRMEGAPTTEAQEELARMRARVAELEALQESWELPDRK